MKTLQLHLLKTDEKYFQNKKAIVLKHTEMTTGIEKLYVKYNALKPGPTTIGDSKKHLYQLNI